MFGPLGTFGSAGAAPRDCGMNPQTSPVLSSSHSHEPVRPFSGAPAETLVCAVATSPMYRSMPESRVLVKLKRLPSGENWNPVSFAPAGTAIGRSAPVATVRNV